MKKEFEKIKELAADIRIAMLTTVGINESLQSRPMALNDIDKDGTMWFFTSKFSEKVQEIKADSQVNVSFSDKGSNNFLSISAKATLVTDKKQIESKFGTFTQAWFPEGTDSEKISLLRVTPEKAEYWDGSVSKLVELFRVGKALLTGETYEGGEHGVVEL